MISILQKSHSEEKRVEVAELENYACKYNGDTPMPKLPFFTVDVFTAERFGGNPLAVVMASQPVDSATMQAVAAEFNLSETTFVLPPKDPANTAQVRIFNRTTEMAFAGHPMVGTAFVLANQRPDLTMAAFEIPAGVVRVRIDRSADGMPSATTIDVPQPLTVGGKVGAGVISRILQLTPDDVIATNHAPMVVSNGTPFVVAELKSDALGQCEPDLAAFRNACAEHPQLGGRLDVHVYCREAHGLRARMFAPLGGTWEDPATGSANAALACLLLSLQPVAEHAAFSIRQGIEMGRPSLLHVDARLTPEGIVASLRGTCVAVMQGEISV